MTRTLSAVGGARPDVDRNIRTVVKMLLAATDQRQADLPQLLGWSKSVTYSRLSGGSRFFAWEVQALADLFEVPVDVFHAGPTALVRRADGQALGNTLDYSVTAGTSSGMSPTSVTDTIPAQTRWAA